MDKKKTDKKAVFERIYGEEWHRLHPAIKGHTNAIPFTNDVITLKGTIDIEYSPMMKLVLPFVRFTGALMPYDGKNIPCTTYIKSEENSDAVIFDRVIHYSKVDPKKEDGHFTSRMFYHGPNTIAEFVKMGVGIYVKYFPESDKDISLDHGGYFWNILGFKIPVPLGFILGDLYGEEEALSEDTYRMVAGSKHFLFGQMFEYRAKFKIEKE